ncbi:MAG: protein phosphatase [Gemmobacter sp.]|nr:protein phosphatase [Gemmobacter sp.]
MTFGLYVLPVAGGMLALSPCPGKGGHFEADLAQVLGWAPSQVISMTGVDEMAAMGAQGLGAALDRAGVAWAHAPVEDYGVPGSQTNWPVVAAQARAVLSAGGRVLVHCMGGCGRSGMAALRLMVDSGEAPVAALLRLRAVRPCAVETEAQRIWASTP